MADFVFFPVHDCRCIGGSCEKGGIQRASRGDGTSYHKLDKVPAICTHDWAPCTAGSISSAAVSGDPSVPRRNRYQRTMAASEKTKMMVEMALISGVMPRRRRPQISSGNVLSRPIRKKLTAISSMESVKISRAAPTIDSFKFGKVTRRNVCQYVAPRSREASSC